MKTKINGFVVNVLTDGEFIKAVVEYNEKELTNILTKKITDFIKCNHRFKPVGKTIDKQKSCGAGGGYYTATFQVMYCEKCTERRVFEISGDGFN